MENMNRSHLFDEIFEQQKVDIIYSAYMMDMLYQQHKLGKHCDLKVLVGETEYSVHSCVFATTSTTLDDQLAGLEKIHLNGVTSYGFECVLEILYCGKLKGISSLSNSMFQQIITAADAIKADTVMKYCLRERSDLMKAILRKKNKRKATETTTTKKEPASFAFPNTANLQNQTVVMEDNKILHPILPVVGVNNITLDKKMAFDNNSKEAGIPLNSNVIEKDITIETPVNGDSTVSDTNASNYTCQMCGELFHTSVDLRKHTLLAHAKDHNSTIVINNMIPTTASTNQQLLQLPLAIVNSASVQQITNSAQPLLPLPIVPYTCNHCNEELKSLEMLEAHIKMSHGQPMVTAKPIMSSSSFVPKLPGSIQERQK